MRRTFFAILGFGSAVAGCGGVASSSDGPNADGALPPSGFYSVQVDSTTNCDAVPANTHDQLVGSSASGVNIGIWGGARQDIPWDAPLASTLTNCETSVRLQVTLKSATSFSVEEDWNWVNPAKCASPALVPLPMNDCTARELRTFELIAACPTTRNNVSCGG
jgi:hypothetical protein